MQQMKYFTHRPLKVVNQIRSTTLKFAFYGIEL